MVRDPAHRPSLFRRAMSDARRFADELVRENARLKGELSRATERERDLSRELKTTLSGWRKTASFKGLERRKRELERQVEAIEARHRDVERENRDFSDRFFDVEGINNRVATVYFASLRLHGSVDPQVVVRTCVEIVVNLLGVQSFGLYLADPAAGSLRRIAFDGQPARRRGDMDLWDGPAGDAARGRHLVLRPRDVPYAYVPLAIEERLVGMLLVDALLSHREPSFSDGDVEIIELLSTHFAAALASSILRAQGSMDVDAFVALLRESIAAQVT
ncbi:MAG: GAF domain-containing protein [Acidobacteriota bacterium]